MATVKPGTYKTLDMWRGLAAFFVVLYHGSLVLTTRFAGLNRNPFYAACHYGDMGVQIFFVVSGYCIANSACSTIAKRGNWWSFMRARLRRIVPPCWASLVFVAAISLAAQALVASGHLHSSTLADRNLLKQTPLYYFANLTMTQMLLHQPCLSIVCWTLCYEMAFYVLVSIALSSVLRAKSEEQLLGVQHVFTAATLLWLIIAPATVPYPFNMWPEFGLGVIAYDVLRHPGALRPRAICGAVTALTLAFIVFRHIGIGPFGSSSKLTFGVSLCFVLILLAMHRFDEAMSRITVVQILGALGAFSYSLYLTHYMSIGLMSQAIKLAHLPERANPIMMLLMASLSIVVARVFYLMFERPFHNAARPAVLTPVVPNLALAAVGRERAAVAVGGETEPII